MSRSEGYTQNGAERNGIALYSASCLCATDGRRLLYPPSADENECGELVAWRYCVRVSVHGLTLEEY
ncbi:unnamed protein product [Danaus chrysippus]|nr:unnamed protein product [Danaus chrysippus]